VRESHPPAPIVAIDKFELNSQGDESAPRPEFVGPYGSRPTPADITGGIVVNTHGIRVVTCRGR